MFFDPLDERAHRLRRRPGGPAGAGAAGHRRPAQPLRGGQAAPAARRAHRHALRPGHRPGHRGRHPRDGRRRSASSAPSASPRSCASCWSHPRRARGMNLLLDLGLVEPILPELVPMKGLPQGPPRAPTGDLWDHVLARARPARAGRRRFRWRWRRCCTTSASRAPSAARRTATRSTITSTSAPAWPTRSACGSSCPTTSASASSGWSRSTSTCATPGRCGPASSRRCWPIPASASCWPCTAPTPLASGRSVEHVEYCEQLAAANGPTDDLNPPPLLTGHDLTRRGLEPGPLFKTLLDAVREAQLDGTVDDAAASVGADRSACWEQRE